MNKVFMFEDAGNRILVAFRGGWEKGHNYRYMVLKRLEREYLPEGAKEMGKCARSVARFLEWKNGEND